MQANGGGGGDVERFLAAGLGNAHVHRGKGFKFGANALPFVPKRPGTGKRQRLIVQGLVQVGAAVRTGNDDRQRQHSQIGNGHAFDQLQAPVRTHAGSQHLGTPERRRALERDDLLETKGTGAAQDRADVASILHAVQDHGRNGRLQGSRRREFQHKTHARGRLQRADAGEQRIGDDDGLARRAGPLRVRLLPERLRKNRNQGLHAALQDSTAQVVALNPDLTQLAICAAVLAQAAQILEQRVVARRDVLHLRGGHRKTSVTGRKVLRCSGQAPCARKAARCSAVP